MTEEKRGRAGNGDDSIYWDKSKNRYIGAISLGYTPAGKRNRSKVSGKTKTEVRAKLREKRRELENGVKTSAAYTVEQAVTDWLSRGLKGREASSVKAYTSLAKNHVIAALGKAKLHELEADDVDDWLDVRAETLSRESLRRVLWILRRSIAHAQRRGRVGVNVAEFVDLPDGQDGRPSKSLSLLQAQALLSTRQGSWIHAYVVLALLVGIRTEEERALAWNHVHTKVGEDGRSHVDVWRSVRRDGETKTRLSRRSLAMPLQAAKVLEDYRARQQAEFQEAGAEWSMQGLVFPGPGGGQRSSTNVRKNLRSLLKEAGLKHPEAEFHEPQEWTTRELRTSFVSLLSDTGVPIEVIAKLVGHSTTATTERFYRKQLRPVIAEGAEAMDAVFESDRNDDQGASTGT
ncbi:site-specific integrase [Streptomyces sp. CB02959]|uniref:tyrosine-type recombinase/integrase n=1 Tax=Streptomyces sp. CB02959 TaxID=2020330 RepID=UPI000C2782D1|nr:tyrosine-type recombinase/integrase [Streptomyces sp. CB02959]PJN37965.1 site-specific integrase [Streptomyces sp. CB02959]